MPTPLSRGDVEIDAGSLATAGRGGAGGDLLSLEADVGLAPGIETDIVAPLAATRRGRGFALGAGEVELAQKFRLVDPSPATPWPSVAAEPTLIAPTRGSGTGHPQILLPLWFSRDVGAWNVFGGGGATINPGSGQRDFALAGLGLVRSIGPRWRLGGELYDTTASARDDRGGLTVDLDIVGEITGAVHVFASIGRSFGPEPAAHQATLFAGLQLAD